MDVLFILALYHQSVVTCILEIGDTGTVSPFEYIMFQFLQRILIYSYYPCIALRPLGKHDVNDEATYER